MKASHALAALSLTLAAVGCQPNPPADTSPNPAIPATAVYAKEGSGRLWFQASHNGVAHVYDADTAQFVFATAMTKEQRLVIDPMKDRATVEGKPVYEKPMPRRHTYRIYFEPFGKLPPPPKEPGPLEPPRAAPATAPAAEQPANNE